MQLSVCYFKMILNDTWRLFIFELCKTRRELHLGMGRTWEKFSSLPTKKPQKLETATGKENF